MFEKSIGWLADIIGSLNGKKGHQEKRESDVEFIMSKWNEELRSELSKVAIKFSEETRTTGLREKSLKESLLIIEDLDDTKDQVDGIGE